MIDKVDALTTLRSRMLGATVATTTGSISATSTGYARAAGSFITDGYSVGMEITSVTGFSTSANNQATTSQGRVITAVTALALTCSGTTSESAATVTITVALPYAKVWNNTKPVVGIPAVGFPYLADRFVPATHSIITFPASSGQAEETGLYFVTVFGMAGDGEAPIRRYADAILERFTPGTPMTMDSGDVIRVAGVSGALSRTIGPTAGQIIPLDGGRAYCQLTIPWLARSQNAIAA